MRCVFELRDPEGLIGQCEREAVGEIVASGGRPPGWPLVGAYCERHGTRIAQRAPALDPDSHVEFRRYAAV